MGTSRLASRATNSVNRTGSASSSSARASSSTRSARAQSGGTQRRPYWTCLNCAASENWAGHGHCPSCFCPRPTGTKYTDPAIIAAAAARQAASPTFSERQAAEGGPPGAPTPAPWAPPDAAAAPPAAPGVAPPPAVNPAEESLSIKAALKTKRDFLKSATALQLANPGDQFFARVSWEAEAAVNCLQQRLEALRPPEAQLAQVLGAVQHKKAAVAKLVAEVDMLDKRRHVMADMLVTAEEELAELQVRLDALRTTPAPPPPAREGCPVAALRAMFTSAGAQDSATTEMLNALQARLAEVKQDVPMGTATPDGGSPTPAPAPAPWNVNPGPFLGPSGFIQTGHSPFVATPAATGSPGGPAPWPAASSTMPPPAATAAGAAPWDAAVPASYTPLTLPTISSV